MKKQNHAGKKLIAVVLAMLLLVSFSLSACSSEETQSKLYRRSILYIQRKLF